MNNCIFITFDDDYFKYARVCLTSLSRNYPYHPKVKVGYMGNDAHILSFIKSLPNAELIDSLINISKFKDYNLGVIGSPMIYVRLVLWSELFQDFDNVLYLDCDTVILKPFPELFNEEDFFVVSDNSRDQIFHKEMHNDKNLFELLVQDGITLDELNGNMLNSGVFVIPRKYRSQTSYEQMPKLSERYNKFIVHSDQSIISIWCTIKHISISSDFRYNFQTHFIYTKAILDVNIDSIKILHYAYFKPEKNFDRLVAGAKYVLKAYHAFSEYS